ALQGAENLTGVHGDAVGAHGVEGVDEQRVADHADLHALEVFQRAYRLLGVEAAAAGFHPRQADHVEVGVGDGVEDFLTDLAVDHLAHVLDVTEHERHVEDVGGRHHRANRAEADAGQLDGADLGLFDHFLLGTQHAACEHARLDFTIAGGFQFLAEVLHGDYGRVAGRVDFGNLQ